MKGIIREKLIQYGSKGIDFLKNGYKKAKDYFTDKKKPSAGKNSQKEKEQGQREQTEQKQNYQPQDPKKNWAEEINTERDLAANQDIQKARGRAPGDLDKIENASTTIPGKQLEGQDGKVEEIEETRGVDENIEDQKANAEKEL